MEHKETYEINMNQSKNKIIKDIIHSSDNLNSEDHQMLFSYYKYLHYVRHNMLHYLVLESLGQKWSSEKEIGSFFREKILLPDEYYWKTPDIIHLININNVEKFLIIDVSIVYDIHKTNKEKMTKYQTIVN